MQNLFGRLLLIAVLSMGVWSCDEHVGTPPPKMQGTSVDARPGAKSPPPSNAAPHPSEKILVAFGDSLTAGAGVPATDSYPARLQEKLTLSGYHYRVINAGVSGETTAGGLRRVDWVLKSKPDIIVVELGANDGLRGLDLQASKANLAAIIQQFLRGGSKVILAGMKIPLNYGAAYTETFEGMYGELAKQFDVPLIPFFLEGVAAQSSLNQADGIHPTQEGYALVVENVWRVLEPHLQK